jgi:hypothetical protein
MGFGGPMALGGRSCFHNPKIQMLEYLFYLPAIAIDTLLKA